MCQALVGRAIVKIVAVAGLSVFVSTSADAGLRFGPGAVLGVLGVPLHMMTHGVGAPSVRRHAAHRQGAAHAGGRGVHATAVADCIA